MWSSNGDTAVVRINVRLMTSFLTLMIDDFGHIRPSLTTNKWQGLGYISINEFRSLLVFHLLFVLSCESSDDLSDATCGIVESEMHMNNLTR